MFFNRQKFKKCEELDEIMIFLEKNHNNYNQYISFFSQRYPKVIQKYKKFLMTVDVNLFTDKYLLDILKNVIKNWIEENFSKECLDGGKITKKKKSKTIKYKKV